MSFIYEGRAGYSRKLICAAYASAAVVSLQGQVSQVHAAVFEQTCNDKIIELGDGAPAGAPSRENTPLAAGQEATPSSVIEFGGPVLAAIPNVPAGEAKAAEFPPPASSCTNSPVGATSRGVLAMKAIHSSLSLPAPKRMTQTFSDDQLQMRKLTAKVGSQFADTPGVRRANLDEPAFIRLFTTLVHRESNFRPRAVSPAGARGLGQLMPATARQLGVKDSFAPEENLVGAATYLTDMLQQFGTPELALAAYNAGPNAVVKHGGIPPYRETRQYVADIFHEVLREPGPSRETEEMSDLARRGLAAFAAETRVSGIESPFNAVLSENTNPQTDSRQPGLLAFTGVAEAAGIVDPPSHLTPGTAAPAVAGGEEDAAAGRVQVPDRKPDAPEKAEALPSPDLSTLPKPREFGNVLSKSQLAMRDLAVDIALQHAKASGIKTAGLSEEAFVVLFVSLIRRESSFNRRAVSRDGARGLGQLMPDTVRALKLKDAFAPKENLQAAAVRLVQLLDQFGSPALAIAAYNAGEKAITDRTAIPKARGTRQLVADVLYDLNSEPRPDFIAARFKVSPPTNVTMTGEAPGGLMIAAGQAGASARMDTSFIDGFLSALSRMVSEVTLFLQSWFGSASNWLWAATVGARHQSAPTPAKDRTPVEAVLIGLPQAGQADSGKAALNDVTAGMMKPAGAPVVEPGKEPSGNGKPKRRKAGPQQQRQTPKVLLSSNELERADR